MSFLFLIYFYSKLSIWFDKTRDRFSKNFKIHSKVSNLLCFLFLPNILIVSNSLHNLRNLPHHNFGNLYKVRHLNCLLLAMFDYTGMIFWQTFKIEFFPNTYLTRTNWTRKIKTFAQNMYKFYKRLKFLLVLRCQNSWILFISFKYPDRPCPGRSLLGKTCH